MRLVIPVSLLAMASAAFAASDLVHDWRQENDAGEVRFISNHKAPVPFSMTGEPEATMTLQLSKAEPGTSLPAVLKSELEQIRAQMVLGDYLEQDRKPDRGIVSYIEQVDGVPVAFIKYRVVGMKGQGPVAPRSATHAILLKKDNLYFVHLLVLYAGHQDEVRGDQLRVVRFIIKN